MSLDKARGILSQWLQRKGLLKNPSSLEVSKGHYKEDFAIYRGKQLLGKCSYCPRTEMFCDIKLFGLNKPKKSFKKQTANYSIADYLKKK